MYQKEQNVEQAGVYLDLRKSLLGHSIPQTPERSIVTLLSIYYRKNILDTQLAG